MRALFVRYGRFCKYFYKRHFLKQGDTENLQNFVETAVQVEVLFDQRRQHIDGDGDPDLDLDGIERGA